MLERASAAIIASLMDSGAECGAWVEGGFAEPYTVKVDGNIDPKAAARAVIEAMRELTPAMIEAAIAPYRYGNTEQFDEVMRATVREYWQAGIDAALAGGD